jgi:hypothetical protein
MSGLDNPAGGTLNRKMKTDGLEINQDLNTQRKTWMVQRIGWAGMALIVLAGLAGLFGSGPLARTTLLDDQRLVRLEYDRFGRYEGELLLRLELMPEVTKSTDFTVWVDRSYWTKHAIEQITPPPVTAGIGVDGFLYTFRVDASHVPATIIFHLRPEYLGSLDGHIHVNDGSSIRFHQFIFP